MKLSHAHLCVDNAILIGGVFQKCKKGECFARNLEYRVYLKHSVCGSFVF